MQDADVSTFCHVTWRQVVYIFEVNTMGKLPISFGGGGGLPSHVKSVLLEPMGNRVNVITSVSHNALTTAKMFMSTNF